MVKKLLVCAGLTMLAGTLATGAWAQVPTYDTNATSVISSVVNDAQSSTVVSAVIGGFTGGGTGGTPGLFGGQQLSDTQTQQRGFSAGGVEKKLAIWVNGAYSTFDEDQTAIDSDGDIWAVAFGADWHFSDTLLAGVSLGYEYSDVSTTFNLGSLETDGVFVAPYLAYKLTSYLFLDATVGYSSLSTDSQRTSGGAQITGSYDSERWFGAANITARLDQGKWTLLPGAGILYTNQESDSYTESNAAVVPGLESELGRLRAGARVEYRVSDKFVPYARGDLEYDFEHDDIVVGAGQTQPSYEDTGVVLGAGAVLRLSDRIRASFEGSTVLGRDDYEQYNLTGNLRFAF
jgi:outer membrane autotransporter protein